MELLLGRELLGWWVVWGIVGVKRRYRKDNDFISSVNIL